MVSVGEALGYDVQAVAGAPPPGVGAVLVAAHGRGDEDRVLADAVRAGVSYVGLIASPKRGAAVVASLDLDEDQKRSIHTPAGLDIGARSPAEIAVSVYAQIIAERVQPRPRTAAADQVADDAAPTAIDPVCGMTVVVSATALHAEVDGVGHYFCGAGCRRAFLADPSAYVGS
jgi:xanthine dehydrogenase accessory factor